jgi:hypothetical protein
MSRITTRVRNATSSSVSVYGSLAISSCSIAAFVARPARAERAEVERLANEGLSVRQIAAEVFGHARFRGRVERILRRPAVESETTHASRSELPRPDVPNELDGLGTTELLRVLFERRLARLAASEEPPSLNELRNLLDVYRQLETRERFEQTQALTRNRRERSAPPGAESGGQSPRSACGGQDQPPPLGPLAS